MSELIWLFGASMVVRVRQPGAGSRPAGAPRTLPDSECRWLPPLCTTPSAHAVCPEASAHADAIAFEVRGSSRRSGAEFRGAPSPFPAALCLQACSYWLPGTTVALASGSGGEFHRPSVTSAGAAPAP